MDAGSREGSVLLSNGSGALLEPGPRTRDRQEHSLTGHTGAVLCFTMLEDRLLFSGCVDSTIKVGSSFSSCVTLILWKTSSLFKGIFSLSTDAENEGPHRSCTLPTFSGLALTSCKYKSVTTRALASDLSAA